MKKCRLLVGSLFAIGVVLGAPSASAVPMAVGPGAFSPSDTLITFDTIANDVEITSQFAGLGLTVSGVTAAGRLFGETDPFSLSLFPSPGAAVAANFANFVVDGCGCGDTILDFSTTITRAGFDIATNPVDDLILTAFRLIGSVFVLTGSVLYVTDDSASFAGIEDLAGFDRLVIDVTGPGPSISLPAYVINDLRFPTSVPEPMSSALFGLALAGMGLARRRLKHV